MKDNCKNYPEELCELKLEIFGDPDKTTKFIVDVQRKSVEHEIFEGVSEHFHISNFSETQGGLFFFSPHLREDSIKIFLAKSEPK